MAETWDVVIVGAGVSGGAAAYHLREHPVRILVLDAGIPGRGSSKVSPARGSTKPSQTLLPAPTAATRKGQDDEVDETEYMHGVSGSAVPGDLPVKMIITTFPNAPHEFVEMHGEKLADDFLRISEIGLETEKTIASRILPNPKKQLKVLGSLYVAEAETAADLERDYAILKRFGADCELWDEKKVSQEHGEAAKFTRGIFFPRDAIIHSAAYAQALLEHAGKAKAHVEIRSNHSPVIDIIEQGTHALIKCEDGTEIRGAHVIASTGGIFRTKEIAPFIRPCWSYLSIIPVPAAAERKLPGPPMPDSMNYFTHHFTHDWAHCDGYLRVSGEDHYSALKPPRSEVRCKRLADWCFNKYPNLHRAQGYSTLYGVYSETPDLFPIAGKFKPDSRIVYLMGCNAWGQATMSFCALLVPSLLGLAPAPSEFAELAPQLARLAAAVSPARSSLKPIAKL